MHECIYLPAQIGPLSVWSLLGLLLKDSEQRYSEPQYVRVRVRVCVRGELRCVPAGPAADRHNNHHLSAAKRRQKREHKFPPVIWIPPGRRGCFAPRMRERRSSRRSAVLAGSRSDQRCRRPLRCEALFPPRLSGCELPLRVCRGMFLLIPLSSP